MNSILMHDKLVDVIQKACYTILVQLVAESEDQSPNNEDINTILYNKFSLVKTKLDVRLALQNYLTGAIDAELYITDKGDASTSASWSPYYKQLYLNPEYYPLTIDYLVHFGSFIADIKVVNGKVILPTIDEMPMVKKYVQSLVSTVVHELQHTEQSLTNPSSKTSMIGKMSRLDNRLVDTGYRGAEVSKSTQYTFHSMNLKELQAIANELLSKCLISSGWMDYTEKSISNKAQLFGTPSKLVYKVISIVHNNSTFKNSQTNVTHKSTSDDPLVSAAMKKLYKYIVTAVNDWWYEKTSTNTDQIENLLIQHNKGIETRLSKYDKHFTANNALAPDISLTDADTKLAYQKYMDDPIVEVNNQFIHYEDHISIKTDAERNGILLKMVQMIIQDATFYPVSVINSAETKFDFPTIQLNLKEYNKSLYSIFLSKTRDTVFSYSQKQRTPANKLKYTLTMNPHIINDLAHELVTTLISFAGHSKNLATRIKNTQHTRLMHAVDVKRELAGISTSQSFDAIVDEVVTIINNKAAEFMRTDIEWEYNPNKFDISIYKPKADQDKLKIVYGTSCRERLLSFQYTDSVGYTRRLSSIAVNEYSLADLSKKLYEYQTEFYPILTTIFRDLNKTISAKALPNQEDLVNDMEPDENHVVLTTKQFSNLRKIIKLVGLGSLSKIKDQDEMQHALKHLRQDYKTSILTNDMVDEKFKSVLMAFMYA